MVTGSGAGELSNSGVSGIGSKETELAVAVGDAASNSEPKSGDGG